MQHEKEDDDWARARFQQQECDGETLAPCTRGFYDAQLSAAAAYVALVGIIWVRRVARRSRRAAVEVLVGSNVRALSARQAHVACGAGLAFGGRSRTHRVASHGIPSRLQRWRQNGGTGPDIDLVAF